MQFKEKEENIFFCQSSRGFVKGVNNFTGCSHELATNLPGSFSLQHLMISGMSIFVVVEIYQTSEVKSLTCGSSESCNSKIMECVITLILKNLCYY